MPEPGERQGDERGAAEADTLRRWIESQGALFESMGAEPAARAGALFRSWGTFAEAWTGAARARASGREPEAGPFDPAGWLRAPGGGGMADLMRWIEMPGFQGAGADVWRGMVSTREWLAYLTAVEQIKAVMAEGWIGAFRRFVEALQMGERTGEPTPDDWAGVEALWQAHSEQAITALYRSDPFLKAQADLVAAETALRARLRREADRAAEALGLPSRREFDDMADEIHRLRRELRALRKGSGGR